MKEKDFLEEEGRIPPAFGMDLRDYFAGKAMQSLFSIDTSLSHEKLMDHIHDANIAVAKLSYLMADAMMKVRKL